MTSHHLPPFQTVRPSSPASVVRPDLDAQIEQLEQRLIAREAWLRSTTGSLAQRAQRAVTPRPWILPVVGSGLVLWMGWRLWHRRDRDPEPQVSVEVSANVAGRQDHVLTDLPWPGLTALVWPHTPLAWREHLSPAAAAAVVSTLLLIGRRLMRRRIR